MRAKAIGPLLGVVAVATLLIPGAAAGAKPTGQAPAGRTTRPQLDESLEVQGTNGFTVTVALRNRSQLGVTAEAVGPGKEGARSAFYGLRAPQAPGSDGIEARIGNLGRIDVRFVPESSKEVAPILPGCSGGKTVLEKGHFVGFISFRGEQGYTTTRARRAAGTITREPALTCTEPKSQGPHQAGNETEAESEKAPEVRLHAVGGGGTINFDADRVALKAADPSRVISDFTAVAARRRGKIKEIALALAVSRKGSAFLSPNPLLPTDEAVIAPPFPFSGSATFRHESTGAPSWSGDLKVELPGFGDVALAGKGSRATMCDAPRCSGL